MSRPGALNNLTRVHLPSNWVADALEMGWLIAAILTPLWVNFWAEQPFELSKVLLLRSLVWLMTAIWLADWLTGGDDTWTSLRRNPLLSPVGLLAIALLVATLFAVNPRVSLFGTNERGQGSLTLLSYLLLFLVVASRLRTRAEARRLLTAMVATAVVIVPLSLLQAAGWDPIGLTSDARTPITATFGRANFVGAHLAMLAPLTLALALVSERRGYRGILSVLLVGELAVIALTLARAAWLSAATGLALFGLLWVWPRLSRHRQRLVTIGCVSAIAMACVVGGALLLQAQTGSVAARRTIWIAVAGLISERPLLGYGPDALKLVFPRVYPPQLVYYQGRSVFVDRAHNLLLDWAVTLGIPGALALLWAMGTLFSVGLRRLIDGTSEGSHSRSPGASGVLPAACLAAVAGNLAGNLFSFDVTATAVTTWLLAALVTSPGAAFSSTGSAPDTTEETEGPPRVARWRWWIATLLLIGTAAAIVQANGRPLLASVAERSATRHLELGDTGGALAAAQRAVDLWPWEAGYHRLLAQVTWRETQQADDVDEPSALAAWAQTEEALMAAFELVPEDYAAWVVLGDFYATVGAQIDADAFSLAHHAYEQAVALAPHHARLYVAWGEVFLTEGRPDMALAHFQRAVDLDATDGLAFRLVGDVTLMQGRTGAALEAYQEATHWSPESAPAHLGLARSHEMLGQRAAARAAAARAYELDPDHPTVRAFLQHIETTP